MLPPSQPGDLVPIPASDCFELLRAAPWVRIGFVIGSKVLILPINIVLRERSIFFRTVPGSKLASAAAEGSVAIEADDGDPLLREGWSVVVQGHASIVTDEKLEADLLALPFEPWAVPGIGSFWVEVEVDSISGRRIIR